ncbi:MAG TPA: heme ABC transporter ATP-binding protein [Ktedonobacter sp.]|nr:heme ABC transporter ATP-binding protein [Ktedonobacter sp.]
MVGRLTKEQSELDALLEVESITFGYEREPLLYEVSMQVQTGEMVGLLGPNGSGKTTLLRLLSGVLVPCQGTIYLKGRDLRQWGRRSIAQRIALVPQELHMPFAFTVDEMVYLGRTPFVHTLSWSKTQQDDEIVADAMHITGVDVLAGRIFNELSGGERQRVMIAMALAQEPSVLLLDEPTSHLDIKYQIETLELVQRLNREQHVTIIAAMHDLNLASRYFPRLLLFQRGVVADAGPAEVLEPGLLRRVYGIDVQVGIMRGAKHLSVLPPEDANEIHENTRQPQVHVICGGGSGEVLMRGLADAQIPFVAGALNIGDSDYTLALRLADDVIVEQPYAPIAQETVARVRASLNTVPMVVVCPTPVGSGNIVLLQEVVHAAQRGLTVLLLASNEMQDADMDRVQQTGIGARDYTDGQGVALIQQLLESGAIVVPSVKAAIEQVKHHGTVRLSGL